MWTSKYANPFVKYGVRFPGAIQMRAKVIGKRPYAKYGNTLADVLIKIGTDGSVEMSMNGTARWKTHEEFAEFIRLAGIHAWTARYHLDTLPDS